MVEQPTISTHVLDAGHGRPRAGVEVNLYRLADGIAVVVGGGRTDGDGRVERLMHDALTAGEYRLEFAVNGPFFKTLAITFRVDDVTRSYHVPLLLAPYSMTTYRGS